MGLAALLLAALALAMAWPLLSRSECNQSVASILLSMAFVGCVGMASGTMYLVVAWLTIVFLVIVNLLFTVAGRALMPEDAPPGAATVQLRPDGWFEWFCAIVVAIALGFTLINAFAPPTGWDATVAHLALPKQYTLAGQIFVSNANTYTGYPHLLHAMYALAFQVGGASGVGVISWVWSALAVAAVFCLGRTLANNTAAYAAAAMTATAPLFFDQAGVASIDLAFAAMVVAAMVSVLDTDSDAESKEPGGFAMIAGGLMGFSVGIRHLGSLVILLVLIALLANRPKMPVFQVLAFIVPAGLIAMALLGWSWLRTGNPVYPFLQDWFPSKVLTNFPTGDFGGHESIREWSVLGFLTFPIQLGLMPDRFDGINASPGIFAVPLGLAALVLGGRRVRIVAGMGLAGIFILYGLQHYARYAWPFFVLLICAGATLLAPSTRFAKALRILVAPGLLFGLAIGAMGVGFKVPVVLGLESERDYLHRRVERYAAFEWVNENILHADYEYAFLTLDLRGYYLDAIVFQNYAALMPLQGLPVEEQAAWLIEQDIRHVLYPVAYVEESPGWVAMGFAEQFRSWLEAPEWFTVITTLETPRRGGEGVERVYILGVQGPG